MLENMWRWGVLTGHKEYRINNHKGEKIKGNRGQQRDDKLQKPIIYHAEAKYQTTCFKQTIKYLFFFELQITTLFILSGSAKYKSKKFLSGSP